MEDEYEEDEHTVPPLSWLVLAFFLIVAKDIVDFIRRQIFK